MKTQKKIKRKIKQPKKEPGSTLPEPDDEALGLTHTTRSRDDDEEIRPAPACGIHHHVAAASRLKRNRQYLVSVTALPEFKTYLAELEAGLLQCPR